VPVWGLWFEGALYFGTARASRKGRNLAHNPAISVHLESGDDAVMMEGRVVEVSSQSTLQKLDAGYRTKYNMPLMLTPENVVYCVRPNIVLAWTEKYFVSDATRWEFPQQ
jgi:pyridoxine/pyridoxamine 5'-phosphate oxidase